MDILTEIIEHKKSEIENLKKQQPASVLEEAAEILVDDVNPTQTDNFTNAFSVDKMTFICEVKKASPSKGVMREDFNHVEIAKIYEQNGAGAVSVLTDEKYFMGKLSFLAEISDNISLPCLRKDFIVDKYQIHEAVLNGASAVLLIAAALDIKILTDLNNEAKKFNLGVLMEIHDERDMEKALYAGANIIGINNRDLKTFKTDLKTTEDLIKNIPPDKTVVSESGINKSEDVKRVFAAGARGVLIGEALMREKHIGAKLRELKKFQ